MVWCVSPYALVDSSLHMALTPCSRCYGDFIANVYALYANSFVWERSVGLFHDGLAGVNCVSSIPRISRAAVFKLSQMVDGNWDEGVLVSCDCSNCSDLLCCGRCCFALVFLLCRHA